MILHWHYLVIHIVYLTNKDVMKLNASKEQGKTGQPTSGLPDIRRTILSENCDTKI